MTETLKTRLKKGNGEFVAFSFISTVICLLVIYLAAIIHLSVCNDVIAKSCNVACRAAAVAETYDDAKKAAYTIAKYQIEGNKAISDLSVSLERINGKKWGPGVQVVVTTKAKVKTIAPVLSGYRTKKILITVEGMTGSVVTIPSSVPQTGVIDDRTNNYYTRGWAQSTPQSRLCSMALSAGRSVDPTTNIATYQGRYLIAARPTFGSVGDKIDFYLANGEVIRTIMADEKGNDAKSKWGHIKEGGRISVIEFESGSTYDNIINKWRGQKVKKAVNLGSIFR